MEFIRTRLGEFGVSNVFTDEWGNLLALFPAFGTRRDFILLVAEVGDADYSQLGNSVHLSGERASGNGLGERSLGAAALLVFSEFAQATGFHLDKNLLVVFTRSSSVDEPEEAFRHFLDGWGDRISCAIFVRGTGVGIVETQQVGSYRLSVVVNSEDKEMLSPGSLVSAASILGEIASQVGNLAWDEHKTASVNIARMEAGMGFGHWATEAQMDFELFADNQKVLESIKHEVTQIIEKTPLGSKTKIDTLVRFKRSVGSPELNQPILDALRTALAKTVIKPTPGFVSDKVALLNEKGIPAVAVGITRLTSNLKTDEIELSPIASGFRQLLLVVEGASATTARRER